MYGYFCIGFMKFVLRSKRRNIDNTPLKWQGFSIWKKKIFWREHYNCPKKLDEKNSVQQLLLQFSRSAASIEIFI